MPKNKFIKAILKFFGLLKEKEEVLEEPEIEEETVEPEIEEETVEPEIQEKTIEPEIQEKTVEPKKRKPRKKKEKLMTHNREKFPNIIHEPENITINDEEYTVFKFSFQGLGDLYNYLKSEPETNSSVFYEISSALDSDSFAGIPYEDAVEQLVNYNDPEYKEFLTITKRTAVKNLKLGAVFQSANSVAGGIVRPQAFAIGDPHIYRTTKVYKVEKAVNLYTTVDYVRATTRAQVYNKAVILTNIIHALEQEGIKVNVNVFSLSRNRHELLVVELNIKNNGRSTNYQALYRTLCNVEFQRRIIFRLTETSDVKTSWYPGYGSPCSDEMVREYYHLDKDDYYFGTPQEMGIKGYVIEEDFERTVKKLKLEKVIDMNTAKEIIRKNND